MAQQNTARSVDDPRQTPGGIGATAIEAPEPTGATGQGSTKAGFKVLWVAIKREPVVFALSTLGSVLFGALTVADAWVLGWSTDNVVLPAFRDGEINANLLWAVLGLFLAVAILRAVGIVARRLGAGILRVGGHHPRYRLGRRGRLEHFAPAADAGADAVRAATASGTQPGRHPSRGDGSSRRMTSWRFTDQERVAAPPRPDVARRRSDVRPCPLSGQGLLQRSAQRVLASLGR